MTDKYEECPFRDGELCTALRGKEHCADVTKDEKFGCHRYGWGKFLLMMDAAIRAEEAEEK